MNLIYKHQGRTFKTLASLGKTITLDALDIRKLVCPGIYRVVSGAMVIIKEVDDEQKTLGSENKKRVADVLASKPERPAG